ncbi:MAG: signal peptidase I [Candidatus Omnitrophica bacterium]|nr:signal peptidase I [Candidatus Omnitrophota bacterium]
MDKDFFIYTGTSMHPTFRTGDILYIDKNTKIVSGDVVVFCLNAKRKIVHRIIKIGKTGIMAQGDNNRFLDNFVINKSSIIGKVIYVKRNNKKIKVYNGKIGLVYFYLLRMRKKILYLCSYSMQRLKRFF